MEFEFTQDQLAFQQLAKDFADLEFAPHAATWDKDFIFPVDALRKAAELGFAAMYVREDVGGAQLSRTDAAIVFIELARACTSTSAYLSIHNMVAWLIDQYADDALRKLWCPSLATMEKFASYCLTEPDSGSDAASLRTTAKRDGNEFILNGSKAFISGGNDSDVYVCMVRTGGPGAKGISCVLVEKGTPGMTFGKYEKKLGWHSQPTTAVFFENCRIPTSNLIGEEGKGFNIALHALNGGRINIAACSLGGAHACLQHALQYTQERQQFNQAISDFQVTQFKLADMYTDYEAARLLTLRAAASVDKQHADAPIHCAMAKRFATDVAFSICDQALLLHGGYGYLQSYPIERFFRDLRVHQILEGSNEIMRVIIARQLMKEQFEI